MTKNRTTKNRTSKTARQKETPPEFFEIAYLTERSSPRSDYPVFRSIYLDELAQLYAELLQFENMFHTMPNMSCKFELRKATEGKLVNLFSANGSEAWTTFIDHVGYVHGDRIQYERRLTPDINSF